MRRRRIAIGVAVVAALSLSCCAVAPGLLAQAAARRLSERIGTPVYVGWLWWNPLAGRWTLAGGRIAADAGPPALSFRRLTASIRLWDILFAQYRVRALILEGARLRLRATEHGWSLPLPDSGAASGAGAALTIDWAAAPRAMLRLEPRRGVKSTLRLRELELSGALEPARTRLLLWTRGRLDRSSIAFAGRLRTVAGGHRARLRLTARGLDLGRTLRLAEEVPVRELRGRLDVRAKYDETGDGDRVQRRLAGSLSGRDVALRAHGLDGAWVREVALPRFALDLGSRAIALGRVRLGGPEVWARLAGSRLIVPGLFGGEPGPAAASTPAWTVTAAGVDIVHGTLHQMDADHGEELLVITVEDATAGAIGAAAVPVPFSLLATLGSGGRLTAAGEVVREPPGGKAHLRLDDLDLPPLVALAREPLQLESGQASATLDVAVGGAVAAAGIVTVRDVKTSSPDTSRPEDVLAFKDAQLAIRRLEFDPPAAAFDRVEINWPYVLIDRGTAGIFPFTLAATAASSPGASVSLRVDRLQVNGGRIDFRDTTLSPPYWRALANLRLEARGVEAPAVRVAELRASGLVDELSPLRVEGSIGTRTRLVAEVERLALPSFNAYLEAAVPYRVLSGALSGRSEVTLDRSQLEVNNRIVLSRLGLASAGDDDVVQRDVGIPLTLALALMKDYRGNIELALPFGGDLRGPTFEMRSVVLQAIVRAVRGAVLSPLNALGRVLVRDGRIENIELDPIPFVPAARDLDARGQERLAQVARVLTSRPDLAVRVRGRVADADLLRLQDEAALSALVEAPAAEPLRAVLRARLAGLPPPPLDAHEQRRLEDLIGGLPWPGQPLHDLAVDRGAVAAARLILDHKLEAERVSTDLPDVPERGRLAASPSVDVELQAR